MPAPSLNLLVLCAEDPQAMCAFYAALGLKFVREQHEMGPVHYSTQLNDAVVLEIYPRGSGPVSTGTRIGFNVPCLKSALRALYEQKATLVRAVQLTVRGRLAVVLDPEGHKVELLEPAIGLVA
jgi:predicted enzyme related to lactoylglutathione lyase